MGTKKDAAQGALRRFLFVFALFGAFVSHSALCAAQTYGSGTYGGGLYGTGNGGGGDITAPTVSVTAPPTGGTLSHSVTLTAISGDDVGVTGVQFKIDTTTLIGSAGATSPYSVTFDSTAVANGSHTIIAVARDAAGNYATSSPVSVIVNNSNGTPPAFSFGGGGGGGGGGPLSFMNPINSLVEIITPLPGLPPNIKFMQNLTLGSRGEQVTWLQIYLNSHGFIVAPTGPGSPGRETAVFGFATRAALIKFQKYHAIKPPVGYFGPITRAYVNSTIRFR